MRIIGGYAAGIALESPVAGPGYKPTMDRVRQAILASLEPLLDLTVVDLFACSGALGLEALSRGAARVAWVEADGRNVRVIQANLERVRPLVHGTPEVRVLKADVLLAPQLLAAWQPDVILADPPYTPEPHQKGALELLTDAAFGRWAGGALVVIEQSRHHPLDGRCLAHWQVARERAYGTNLVYYLRAGGAAG